MKTFAARSLGTLANCLLVAVSFLSVDSQAQVGNCVGAYYVNLGIREYPTCSTGYLSYDLAYRCSDGTLYGPQGGCGSPIPSCSGNCPPHEPCTGKIGTTSVGCEEPRDQCEAQAGGPVHVTTGNMWVRPEPDLTIAGPFPLSIRRGYWSVRADRQMAITLPRPSVLGWGWGLSLFESLYVETPPPIVVGAPRPPGPSGESVTVRRWDGALDIFRATLPGAAEHIGQPGKRQSLRFVPASATALASYRLTEENGTVRVFEKSVLRYIEPPGAPALRHEVCYTDRTNSAFPSSSACLCGTSFAAMNGDPVPCKLKPSSGPPVFLNWQVLGANAGLKSLTWNSPTGQEIAKYEYDPATVDLRFAKLARSAGVFETWDYRYDAQHHLTRVVDPALVDAETFTWTNGKVTATTTPTQSFAFTYAANQTTVAEAKGPTSYTLKFNAFRDPTKISAGCGCNTNVAEYIWDSSFLPDFQTGKQGQRDIKAVKYADGSFTSYVLNAAGDRTRVVRGDIDSDASNAMSPGAVAEDRTFHPDFRAETSMTRTGLSLNPGGSTHVIYDYQDPSSSPPDPFCLTAACNDPSDYNKTNVTGLLRREIRKGFTKKTDGTFNPEAVTYVRTYSYDSSGRLASIQGPAAGEETSFAYFAANAPATKAGRLQFIRRKVAAPATFLVTEIVDYDNRGSPRDVIDESGQTWTFTTERERIT